MSLSIYTNNSSNMALNIVSNQQNQLHKTSEKLTSGMGLNRSLDNPAELSVSTNFRTQINGSYQALKNINDGSSLAQTIDGSLEMVIDLYQRMRELSLQSMNATYTSEQRDYMDLEFQQLYQEIGRISQTTLFNSQSLLNHSDGVQIHSDWSASDSNKITIPTIDLMAPLESTTIFIPGTPAIPPTPPTPPTYASLSFQASGLDTTLLVVAADHYTLNIQGQSVSIKSDGALPLTGADIYANNSTDANQQTVDFINNNATLQGLGTSASYNALDGSITIKSTTHDLSAGDLNWTINSDFNNSLNFAVTLNPGTPGDPGDPGSPGTPDQTITIPAQSITNIKTVESAETSAQAIDGYLSNINHYRAQLGGVQNRLDATFSVVSHQQWQMNASNSQLTDIDYASTMVNYIKIQTLLNASQTMLAFSKEIPIKVVHSLLR